jgi:RNA polymerase sigma-70 factor (ECF subfamily)
MTEDASRASMPENWLAEHGDALYRHAYFRLRDQMAAEDAVQETLLAAMKARERFAGRSSERTWLMGILNNKVVDAMRKQMREQSLAQGDLGDEELEDLLFEADGHWRHPPSAWGDPDAAFEQKAFWQALTGCLEELPARQAQAFTLCEVDGVDGEEASKVLGVTTTNIWVMLHRARLRLRECLELTWLGNRG